MPNNRMDAQEEFDDEMREKVTEAIQDAERILTKRGKQFRINKHDKDDALSDKHGKSVAKKQKKVWSSY
jgi:actin-related protein